MVRNITLMKNDNTETWSFQETMQGKPTKIQRVPSVCLLVLLLVFLTFAFG